MSKRLRGPIVPARSHCPPQVSSHELSFRVSVTVPDSGNYSIAARPAATSSGAGSASSSTSSSDGGGGNDRLRLRRQLEETAAPSSPADGDDDDDDDGGDGDGDENGDEYTVTMDWEVDLTRPETLVVSRPSPVTIDGVAVFQFSCSLAGEEPRGGCSYQYQMMAVNADPDWDSLGWLPTVSEKRERDVKRESQTDSQTGRQRQRQGQRRRERNHECARRGMDVCRLPPARV